MYHQFCNCNNDCQDESGNHYGSFETFQQEYLADSSVNPTVYTPHHLLDMGWFWWSCFPGCLPDSDPIGPFTTEIDAINDAQGN